jgi:5-methylcytosine-specific restriction protein A
MLSSKKELIIKELEEGTGTAITAAVDNSGVQSALKIWFKDLDEKHGPVAELRPYGLKGHRVHLSFGNFSGLIIDQILKASFEDVQLAHALVASIREDVEIEVIGQSFPEWSITSGAFQMTATIRDLENPHDDAAIIITCREVMVPLMAAMAELIGYDEIVVPAVDDTPAYEGAILQSTVKRRERNPRNRLLCIRIHGERCLACGLKPKLIYGDAASIIEVHHIEPVALLVEPRPYDPHTDLIPLCPNCHRAIHSRQPLPYSIKELADLMGACRG